MNFIETRGNDGIKPKEVTFSQTIKNPSASFGGLYIPKFLPQIDKNFIDECMDLNYKELTLKIIKLFDIDIDDDILKNAVDLYDNFDNKQDPVPLKKINNILFVNELYHGPTRAFKDMALQPFGYILSTLAKKENNNYLILAATSGDTGPATLNSFANKENIKVVCIYPEGGTSDVQKLQMVTQEGKNLKVIGIRGNFDDAQTALKALLNSSKFKNKLNNLNIKLSAANSVNFGRIIFQIIYHIDAYIKLLKQNKINYTDEIYIAVPSGNFGDALGAYYAKKMGIKIRKILIVSNSNNILNDFINTGIYDIRERKLIKTISPAMDILISSNVERLIYDKFGAKRCKQLMDNLKEKGYYKLDNNELEILQKDFRGYYCDDAQTKHYISEYSFMDNYLLDPHTATCIKAYDDIKCAKRKTVICSTAEWTKFAPSVLDAISCGNKTKVNDIDALKNVAKIMNIKIPNSISSLFTKPILHKTVIDNDQSQLEKEIFKFLEE